MTDISKITLYSGGHKGAEAEFGKLAEAWHMKEVNISFEGHNAERTRGLQILNREELQRGDVSMEIVSKRMRRTYSRTDKIRKVIQSIFHMVNSGHHVIAVGYDQERKRWFSWKDGQWVENTPVITSDTFAGTGTRYLSDDGRQALRDLFIRSFGPAEQK
jgi:hypothetical protein